MNRYWILFLRFFPYADLYDIDDLELLERLVEKALAIEFPPQKRLIA